MRNVITLGGNVEAYGVNGDDSTGRELKNLMDGYGINHAHMVLDRSRRTIEKQRVMAGGQQLVRIDYEDSGDVSHEIREKIVSLLATGMFARWHSSGYPQRDWNDDDNC